MAKKMTCLAIVCAALVLGLSGTNEAQAWFGGRGSSGSCGSSGGFFGGGSHGSSGGSFGGLFSRRGGGSSGGSCGGSYSNDCGCEQSCNSCGCGGEAVETIQQSSDPMNPPAAPRDPGAATGGQTSGGGASASTTPTEATKIERVVMLPATPLRRSLLVGR